MSWSWEYSGDWRSRGEGMSATEVYADSACCKDSACCLSSVFCAFFKLFGYRFIVKIKKYDNVSTTKLIRAAEDRHRTTAGLATVRWSDRKHLTMWLRRLYDIANHVSRQDCKVADLRSGHDGSTWSRQKRQNFKTFSESVSVLDLSKSIVPAPERG